MIKWKYFLYSKQPSNQKINVVNLYYCALNESVEQKDLKYHVLYKCTEKLCETGVTEKGIFFINKLRWPICDKNRSSL